MENPRRYGEAPFRIAVVHGGPGAGGELAPVARELARRRGVLEPIQTATTLEGQVIELRHAIERHAEVPATLVGYSWGAWLACLVASAHPPIVARLVLVSSGPFEPGYFGRLQETRMARLSPGERAEFEEVVRRLNAPICETRDEALARLGALCSKTDDFDPLPWGTRADEAVPCDGAMFHGVWTAAAEMRRTGELMGRVRRIRCPVVAIHGAYDPHPAEGVEKPLSAALREFRFVLLDRCGHTPWLERHARGAFYEALEGALA